MTLAQQIKAIEKLKGAALREKFREVTGAETRSNNRPHLIRRIAQALEAAGDAVAAVTEPPADTPPPDAERAPRSRQKDAAHAKRERDPRLPAPGTVLEREHDGKTIRVKVLEQGFEFRNKTYRSLSAIAREITKCSWNGFAYFGLTRSASPQAKEGA